jgi:hypothetical protein
MCNDIFHSYLRKIVNIKYTFLCFVKTYYTAMLYFTRFLICNHIPPTGAITMAFVSRTNGTAVFLLTLSWYFDKIETNPTLVCISRNRIPEMKRILVKDFATTTAMILSKRHRLGSLRRHRKLEFILWMYGLVVD